MEIFKNSGLPPKRKVSKFMVTPNAALQPGTPLYAAHYRVGDYIDIGAHTYAINLINQFILKNLVFKFIICFFLF